MWLPTCFLLCLITLQTCILVKSEDGTLAYLEEQFNKTLDILKELKSKIGIEKQLDFAESCSHGLHNLSFGVGVDADYSKSYLHSNNVVFYPKNCYEIYKAGYKKSDVYVVQPDLLAKPFEVLCDMEIQNGGWTHIQKRVDGRVKFYRGWRDYKFGFGYLDDGFEFWMGLENIYRLTNPEINELLIELEDRKGEKTYAHYKNFAVGREEDAYPLKVLSGYTGTAGDALEYHLGMKFSTYDLDQDNSTLENCAERYKGGWWYNFCLYSNLNGKFTNIELPQDYNGQCIAWNTTFATYCYSKARMLLRPGSI